MDARNNSGAAAQRGAGVLTMVVVIAVVLGTAVFWYVKYAGSRPAQTLELSAEARQYVDYLKLSEFDMKATESYMKQRIVEITGKIANTGNRGVDTVEIYCVFYDAYGQVVLRQRIAIVRERMGGLKPGETKPFRLPFDDLPESWNRQQPQLVIAGIRFSN